MNIFFLHSNPIKAAANMNYPKLQNKMILEGCQLLSATFNIAGLEAPYKTTHKNHPSRLWLDNDKANIVWLMEHTQALLDIYTARSGKNHKCQGVLNWHNDNLSELKMDKDSGLTLPYLAMGAAPDIRVRFGTETKHEDHDVWLANNWEEAVTAYRGYMQTKDYWLPEYTYID